MTEPWPWTGFDEPLNQVNDDLRVVPEISSGEL